MKKLIIFGAGDSAQLAHFYFTEQKIYQVEAFVVDDSHHTTNELFGLPVVKSSEVTAKYPAKEFSAFIAMGYNGMNRPRAEKVTWFKERAYKIASYISPYCTNFATSIGENAFILEDNTLQPFCKIGNNVTLWSGNHIGHHSTIGDNCFLASHIVVSGGVVIEENCFIGVNATLRDRIRVRKFSLIGAGALLVKDTEEKQVFKGHKSAPENFLSDQIKKI